MFDNKIYLQYTLKHTSILGEDMKKEKVIEETSSKSTTTRILSIDRFRGIAILCMVIAGILSMFPAFGLFAPLFTHFNHYAGAVNLGWQIVPGVTLADLFAAFFIFVIGLSYVKSFNSNEKKYGTAKSYLIVALRYLGLIGIGFLLVGFGRLADFLVGGGAFTEIPLTVQSIIIGFCVALFLVLLILIFKFTRLARVKAVLSNIFRYFIAAYGVLAVGLLIESTGAIVGGLEYHWFWDVLQTIGLSGLIALPFIKFSKVGKLIMSGIILIGLTIFYQTGGIDLGVLILNGGLVGGFSWASILLLGSVFVELLHTRKYWILTASLLAISLVGILGFDLIALKRACTPVYALLCTGLGATVLGLLALLDRWNPKFKPLAWWGGSTLLVYVISYILFILVNGVMQLLFSDVVISIWVAIVIMVVIVGLFTLLSWRLYKKNKHIRL